MKMCKSSKYYNTYYNTYTVVTRVVEKKIMCGCWNLHKVPILHFHSAYP